MRPSNEQEMRERYVRLEGVNWLSNTKSVLITACSSLILSLAPNLSLAQAQPPPSAAQDDPILVYVNEEPLRESDYQKAWRTNQTAQILGTRGTLEIRNDIEHLVFSQAVVAKALDQETRSIQISSQQIQEAVEADLDKNGVTWGQFLAVLQRNGVSEADFRKEVESNLRFQEQFKQVREATSVAEEELEFFFSLYRFFYATSDKTSLNDVRPRVMKDALEIKVAGEYDIWLRRLDRTTELRYPEDSPWRSSNRVVATFNGHSIYSVELNRAIYGGYSWFGLAKDYKEKALDQLIDSGLVRQIADQTGLPFFGDDQAIFEQMLQYQTRNLKVPESESKAYYQARKTVFNRPTSAEVSSVGFSSRARAEQFRTALIRTKDPAATFRAQNVRAVYHGITEPKDWSTVARRAIYEQKTVALKRGREVTRVVPFHGQYVVFYVTGRRKAERRTFEQAKSEIEQVLLPKKRLAAQQQWLKQIRASAEIKVYL
jgi:parvulin-like peptidyl-prolyl isomerase